MIFTRENMVEVLKNNVVSITFTKVDGTERVMRCTLLPEYVPNSPTNDGKVLLQEEQPLSQGSTISVWDTEANGWRSFRVNSVKNMTIS
jgi:hypothetical protein